MGQIEIHTLGGFQVSRNGEILKGFDSDKIRILLAFFAVEAPQPYRRETLAALLWPDANGTESRANLRWALSNLRKIIGDRGALCPFLLTTRQTIQRNPAANFYSDVAEFLAQSQHSLPNPAQLEQATQLYRGEFLAGLNPKDSLPLDEWLLLKRESLARTLVETLKTLSQHYQQNGEYHKALPHARRFVELEPWQEQGHRQLMRLLEATGQRHAALAQYQQCRNILAQTLGIEPETATTELYRRIQNGSPAPASHQPPPLPNPLTPLIGREREFEQICGYLTQSNCRLLTLTGPGGIGKTRLALEIAHHLQAEFRQGVVFVPLSAVQSPAGLLPALADALNFTSRGQGNPRSQLLEFLRDQEILLVLDNFEHLLAGMDLIAEILGMAPSRLKMLVTSRVSLNLPGEQRFPLLGLALPTQAASSLQSSAVKLFIEIAQRIQPSYDPAPADLDAIIEICRTVEGLPLGILLAAAWSDVLAPAEIAAEIRGSLDLLATAWPGVAEQHRSLRAVLQTSWNFLDAGAQKALSALSIFRDDFTRQAAQAVSETSLSTLQTLARQSLLNWSPTGYFHLHEFLRQFGAEKLARNPDDYQRVSVRHADFYLQALAEWLQAFKGPQQRSALEVLRSAHNNALAAWEWAAQQGAASQLLSLVDGICHYLHLRVRYAEGARLCQTTLNTLEKSAGREDGERLKIHLLAWQGRFDWLLGARETACQALEQAQTHLDQLSQTGEEVALEQGLIWQVRGHQIEGRERPQAQEYYSQSLACFREAKAPWEAAQMLGDLGSVAWNLGNYAAAADYHRQALEARRALGDLRGIAAASMSLGTTLLYQGEFAQAQPLIEEGCHMRQAAGDRLGIADSLRNLGFAHMMLGEFDEAVNLLLEGVEIYQSLGLRYGLEMGMLAAALAHQGDFEQAQAWCQRGLAAAHTTGYRRALGYCLLKNGELALSLGNYTQARHSLDESAEVYAQISQRDEHCRVLIAQAIQHLKTGETTQSEQILKQARPIIQARRAFIPLLYYIPAQALLFEQHGETEAERQWLEALAAYPFVAKSQWFGSLLEPLQPGWVASPEDAKSNAGLWRLVDA